MSRPVLAALKSRRHNRADRSRLAWQVTTCLGGSIGARFRKSGYF